MTERASIAAAAQVLEQSYTLLAAELAALDGVIVDLTQYPSQSAANSDRAWVLAAREEVRRAINRNRSAYSKLIGKLDPFGDLYLVQPGAPVVLTPYGIIPKITGFSHYADSTTTTAVVADTPTALPFTLGTINEAQKPADAGQWFDDSRVFGKQDDGLILRTQITIRPTDPDATATNVRLGYATGGLTTRLFEGTAWLNGYDVEVTLAFETTLYVGSTWAATGAQIVVLVDGDAEVTSRSVFISRLHKGSA